MAGKRGWMVAPVFAALFIAAFVSCWLYIDPAQLILFFDQGGFAPVELMTIPLFAAIVPLVWLCCPFSGGRMRKFALSLAVSVLAILAIAKELDLHIAFIEWLYPEVADYHGTPFKMKFLTKTDYPIGAKAVVVAYFGILFTIGGYAIVRYLKPLFKGFFKLHPASWSVAFMGGSGVVVQISDRLPAMLRKLGWLSVETMDKHTGSAAALMKVFEEGSEMALAVFALIAILQAHMIYNPPAAESPYKTL